MLWVASPHEEQSGEIATRHKVDNPHPISFLVKHLYLSGMQLSMTPITYSQKTFA